MTTATGLTTEQVQKAVAAILEVLGEPSTDAQKNAIAKFRKGNYDKVRRIAATNLDDYYCKSLGYLGSAFKLLPNTDTILAESARAAADHREEMLKRAIQRNLSSIIRVYVASSRTSDDIKICRDKLLTELSHAYNNEDEEIASMETLAMEYLDERLKYSSHKIAAINLQSQFCRILSVLHQAVSKEMEIDLFWLHEAANLIVEYRTSSVKKKNLQWLSTAIAEALG